MHVCMGRRRGVFVELRAVIASSEQTVYAAFNSHTCTLQKFVINFLNIIVTVTVTGTSAGRRIARQGCARA